MPSSFPTADEQVAFVQLHGALSRLGYCSWRSVTEDDVVAGSPILYAHFVRFIFMSFPSVTAGLMRRHKWFVIEGNDTALGSSVLRLLSEEYHCVIPLTAAQFAKRQFALQKMRLCVQLIRSLSAVPKRQHQCCARGEESRASQTLSSTAVTPAGPRRTAESLDSVTIALIESRRRLLNRIPRVADDKHSNVLPEAVA